jgi:hypothetical protein
VNVVNAVDSSPTACENGSFCNAASACIQRWQPIATTPFNGEFSPNYTAAIGTKLYFATSSSFRSYDVGSNTFADLATTSEPCRCGYEGTLVPDNGALYYVANQAQFFTPGVGWTSVTYPGAATIGEAAPGVIGTRHYRAGGRGPIATVSYLDAATNTWTTSGIANLPTPISGACGGVIGGKMYVFGGQLAAGANRQTFVYDPNVNAWSTLPVGGDLPRSCYYNLAQVWRSKLVYADSGAGLEIFDPGVNTWAATPTPLPDDTNQYAALVTADGSLYLLGYDPAKSQLTVYKWVLN